MTYEYTTLEYRAENAAPDIQNMLEEYSKGGWRLVFVLESRSVLVLERVHT